jgi:hypothetical protein
MERIFVFFIEKGAGTGTRHVMCRVSFCKEKPGPLLFFNERLLKNAGYFKAVPAGVHQNLFGFIPTLIKSRFD